MKTIFYIFLIIISYSCHSNTKTTSAPLNNDTISLNEYYKNTTAINFSPLYDSAKIIKLEVNPDNIQAYVTKAILTDYIFTFDEISTFSVNRYDSTGRFLNKISQTGKAPGETLKVIDFDIHNNCVYLLDEQKKAIQYYDFAGHYISNLKLPFDANAFARFENGNYIFHLSRFNHDLADSLAYNIIITDSVLNICKKLFKKSAYEDCNKLYYSNVLNHIQKNNNLAIYYDNLNQNIYTIDPDGNILNATYLDLGYVLPEEAKYNFDYYDKIFGKSNLPNFYDMPVFTPDYYFGLIADNENRYFTYFNKCKGEMESLNLEKVKAMQVFIPIGFNQGWLIGNVESSLLNESGNYEFLILHKIKNQQKSQ